MNDPAPNVPLAPLTTLEVGGAAELMVEAASVDELRDALRWAATNDRPVSVLGGGSNVVVADQGVPGLVIRVVQRGLELDRRHDGARMTVAAGEPWDDVVAAAVDEDLAGLECLSGIPGTAGATPIQNVGAYGQEVAAVIDEVRVIHRTTLEASSIGAAELEFGYRTSRLRRRDNLLIVTGVVFRLEPGGAPNLGYAQVADRFAGIATPTLGEVRRAVLELRRGKSMLIDEADPNRRSVGSFFVNPTVDGAAVEAVTEAARLLGVLDWGDRPPAWEVGPDRFKLSAAWLIEHAGFPRGAVRGRVGLSGNHALAVVNRGDATAEELIAFARDVRRGVRSHLGIDLHPEPVFWGFSVSDPTD
jgi:UDP-N-acetylmuramate dehydrogenase